MSHTCIGLREFMPACLKNDDELTTTVAVPTVGSHYKTWTLDHMTNTWTPDLKAQLKPGP